MHVHVLIVLRIWPRIADNTHAPTHCCEALRAIWVFVPTHSIVYLCCVDSSLSMTVPSCAEVESLLS